MTAASLVTSEVFRARFWLQRPAGVGICTLDLLVQLRGELREGPVSSFYECVVSFERKIVAMTAELLVGYSKGPRKCAYSHCNTK